MTDQYRAVMEYDNTVLYLVDAGDPEIAIEEAAFTENPSEAQIFEGKGWKLPFPGASLELVV